VSLSHILDSGIPVADFAPTVDAGRGDIGQRDELVFLISITASQHQDRLLPHDSPLLQLPIREMTLTNADGLSVGLRPQGMNSNVNPGSMLRSL
jgi:hypothetical protein